MFFGAGERSSVFLISIVVCEVRGSFSLLLPFSAIRKWALFVPPKALIHSLEPLHSSLVDNERAVKLDIMTIESHKA